MDSPSGIVCNEKLKIFLGSCRYGSVRLIKVSVSDSAAPELQLDTLLEPVSTWDSDWDTMLPPQLEPDQPCFLLYRLDEKDSSDSFLWVLLSCLRDQETLDLSTIETFKEEFGAGQIKHEYYVNTREDVTLAGYKRHLCYALCLACQRGDIESVRELLTEGLADINNDYYIYLTPLMFATLHNQTSVVSLLLTCKELVLDKATERGSTALHFACRDGGTSFPVIPILGSDKRCTPVVLNKKDNDGQTPLMWAVMYGNLESVKGMDNLQGTDFRTENKFGEGLLDVARRRIRKEIRKEGHMSVLDYLLNRRKVESLKELAARAVASLLSCETDVEKLDVDVPLILHPWVAGFMQTSPIMNFDYNRGTDSESDSSDEEEDILISSDNVDEYDEDDGWNTVSSNDEDVN